MSKQYLKYSHHTKITNYFQHLQALTLGLLVGVAVVGAGLKWSGSELYPMENAQDVLASEYIQLPAPLPTGLRIPAVGIVSTFGAPLGVNEDQIIAVPDSYQRVGWYKYSPTPGEIGPAVVLGHVDSYQGRAVFWSLKNLATNDEIIVERADDTEAVFVVTDREYRQQSSFPAEAVYGDVDHAGLRLITCSGIFDQGTQRYSHNLIIYATLTSTSTATVQ